MTDAKQRRRRAAGKGATVSALDSERRSRGSGTQTAYDGLKSDILELVLPPGEPLDETRLSERFGMSRTPIREALLRLGTEGLVTTLPNRNTVVTPIDFPRLPAFFDALTLMYRITTRTAATRRDEADLDTMRLHQGRFAEAVARTDALAMIATNRAFHMAVALAGRNPYYTDLFGRLLDEGRRMLRLYYRTFGDRLPAPYAAEHDAMIAAIAAGNAERADELAAAHAAQIVGQLRRFVSAEEAVTIDLGRSVNAETKERA